MIPGFDKIVEERILRAQKNGAFDSQATFTPNILFADGKYYLYYTGVKPTPGNEKLLKLWEEMYNTIHHLKNLEEILQSME